MGILGARFRAFTDIVFDVAELHTFKNKGKQAEIMLPTYKIADKLE
jgi:hypothetical protein